MKNGIFITGTDTGVGKTFVATGIARSLLRKGIDVGVMKPAETGCAVRRGILIPGDAIALMRSAQVDDDLDLVNPFRFRAPLAPFVAAVREGRSITMRAITNSFRKLEDRHEFMIVEGAGGIMVPLTARQSYLDLARFLKLPVLIVARPGLGTINHTLLTVMALRRHGVPIGGIVIDHCLKQRVGLAEKTNPLVIERRSGVPVIGIVRRGQKDFSVIAHELIR